MEKMRAVIFKKHGGISELEEAYMPVPEPGANEVLVKVHACAINHLDLWNLSGALNVKVTLPHILGCDVAGEVVAKGKKVRGVPMNAPVIVAPGISCGKCRHCLGGWDSLCPGFNILGFQTNGGFAEYVKVPARNIIPVTKRFTMEEWSSVPLVFLTAWHMLITLAGIKKKETVLIHSAGSGIGSAAIQVAKLMRCRVLTTVGSAEKAKLAASLNPDEIINRAEKDFAAETMRLTRGKGVDVVFEHIGGETFTKSVPCLKKHGRLISCGATAGRKVELDLRTVYAKQLSILGSYMGGIPELQRVIRRIKAGRLKPVVDSVYPLRQARQALKRMNDRENFGKIILKP
jgi:NADPH:quinone reductase-like Zn-dependent oxidoreductase